MDTTTNEKFNVNLKEVLYIPSDNETNIPQLLLSKNQVKKKDSVFLYISAFTANVVAFAGSASFSWSSPALEKLTQNDTSINPLGEPLTSMQESWITALLCLGAAVGPLFTGKSADTIGRKITLILIALLLIAGYVALAFATNIILFYISRFLLGFGLGGIFAVLPMYLAEITEDHNRGKFGCLMTVFITAGIVYPFTAGPLVSLKVLTFSCAVPLMLFVIFFYLFVPETPVFLVISNRTDEAKEALMKLRNKNESEVEKELLEITESVEHSKSQKAGVGDFFKKTSLRNGMIISIGLVTLQQCSGINAIMGFLGQIFDASGSNISTYISTNLVSLMQVVSTGIASATVEKLGRKFLLLTSAVGSSVSTLILGLYFYLKKSQIYNVDSLFWLPIVCLIVYIIAFNVGIGCLPWTIIGEIFPANAKSTASSLASCINFFTAFIITLGFPIVAETLGMAQCFWMFGMCCLLGVIFIYFVVPETKGKTLTEIQRILGGN